MALTRFHDRVSGKDGAVSGALQVIPVTFSNLVTNTSPAWNWNLPAGAEFEIEAIDVRAVGVAGDPQISVGATASTTSTYSATGIAAASTLVTNLGGLTLKSSSVEIPKSGTQARLEVLIANDAVADAAESVSVNIVGYMSRPPISALSRGQKRTDSNGRTVGEHF